MKKTYIKRTLGYWYTYTSIVSLECLITSSIEGQLITPMRLVTRPYNTRHKVKVICNSLKTPGYGSRVKTWKEASIVKIFP